MNKKNIGNIAILIITGLMIATGIVLIILGLVVFRTNVDNVSELNPAFFVPGTMLTFFGIFFMLFSQVKKLNNKSLEDYNKTKEIELTTNMKGIYNKAKWVKSQDNVQEVEQKTAKEKFCSECGANITIEDKFCSYCGKKQ